VIDHGIQLDHEREARLGFDEAIYAAGNGKVRFRDFKYRALDY